MGRCARQVYVQTDREVNVVLSSAFRNSQHTIARYCRQVSLLNEIVRSQHNLRVLAAEGDSVDRTRYLLTQAYKVPIEIVDVTHGGPVYGSTEAPARMAQLSVMWNKIMDAVKETDDVFLYVESDLIWEPITLARLIDRAAWWQDGFDVFAPMVCAGPNFYDIWAFRKNGTRFSPFPPYHPELKKDELLEVDSVGSCLSMRAVVARQCRIHDNNAIVGWCKDVRHHGYRIAVCPDLKIHHP